MVDTIKGDASLLTFDRNNQCECRVPSDVYSRLQHQSLGRPLTDSERALAAAIEAVFSAGQHDFEDVARALEQAGVMRPSGAPGPWTPAVLEQELAAINDSLDAAYAANGIGA